MKVSGTIFLTLASTLSALGQHVIDPRASVVDLTSRQAMLRSTTDSLPSLIKPYTTDTQSAHFGSSDFAALAFYAARFGTGGLPPAIVNALKQPTESTRIGGNTSIMAAK
jgi:hypothetical protein